MVLDLQVLRSHRCSACVTRIWSKKLDMIWVWASSSTAECPMSSRGRLHTFQIHEGLSSSASSLSSAWLPVNE